MNVFIWNVKEYNAWVKLGCPVDNNVQWLYISGNIKSITPKIGNLTALRELYITNSQLTTLPAEIGHLKTLSLFFLVNNTKLTTLPAEIGQLTNLIALSVAGNPIECIPRSVSRLLARLTAHS